ncbi:FKBP-type peptidyl-prolyl cis-trans isomerase [Flavobacterium eburneipallidum]|uniref:FKBP-type peptidyl-prolyl cis-trans isomerase n=1 Tax=Flavobacterium eburneipallidum TaxID=3003263 RepID=UPI0022AC7BDC|nr:FKBP-type peptidylprolyl isomerase [Flavobacterium eburneipallidum]
MNKFKFYFILLITTVTLFSCSKNDDDATVEPIRDFQTQYNEEIEDIEDYLKENTFTVTNAPGQTSDQDVVISKITDPTTQRSIISYLDAPTYPKLLKRPVKLHNVDYVLYYLVLREGVGKSPTNVDGVFASYKGTYLYRTTATPSTLTVSQFEEVVHPQEFLSLYTTITGWGEIFPQFKSGTNTVNSNGTVTYNDFGAGVMFLPSGLGYYNTGSFSIPAYSPLIFSFKLYEIQRNDQDKDGIPSYLEDHNHDGYMYDFRNTTEYPTQPADNIRYADDTEKDGIPDFLDVDDDGDNYTTKFETQYIHSSDPNKTVRYYPFDGVLVDDPTTPFVDERQGIPSYDDKKVEKFDYTTPGRKRIHLDNTYPPAKK